MTPDQVYAAAIGPAREAYWAARRADEVERNRPGKREENEAYLRAMRPAYGPLADFNRIRDAAFDEYFAVLQRAPRRYCGMTARALTRYEEIVKEAWAEYNLPLQIEPLRLAA